MIYYTARIKFLLFVILFLGTAAEVLAAEGDLDVSFDGDGIVTTDHGMVSENVTDLVVQPDGKIIAIGYSLDSSQTTRHVVIVRYNTNGSVDTNFGTSGKVTIQAYYPGKIALQPDGKIVFVVLLESSSTSDFYVARLNADGSFDTTFNSTGVLNLDLRGTADGARAVALQPDGKIVIGGSSARPAPATGSDHAIVRLNPNGSLDTTFDGDGKAFASITAEGTNGISELVMQSDGKIVTAGISVTQNSSNYQFVTVRFNADGALDTSFDGDGKVFTQVGTGYASVGSVALQCDGKIVVAGTPTVNSHSKAALVRYNSDGSLDSSFASGGIMLSPWAFDARAHDVMIQADNKIIVGAMSGSLKQAMMSVGRFNPDGSPDTTFSSDGWHSIPGSFMTFAESYAVAIQLDGKIVTGGYSTPTGDGSDFTLARFDASSGPANCSDKVADFDGDGKTDVSFFRNGTWYVKPSGAADPNSFYSVQFGLSNDRLTPADFDGDGRTDIALFRDGMWHLLRSQLGYTGIQFGTVGDTPVPADYDGDGRADLAVFRAGSWYILGSQAGFYGFQFGVSIDRPVPGDFDGDGRTDPAVFRDGNWFQLRSRQGFTVVPFGVATDRPVVGDYDGDGRADQAVYRTGLWYVLASTQGFYSLPFGISTDTPVVGDYDADGKSDIAVYRTNGVWYQMRSLQGFTAVQFGGDPSDKPIPSVYVPWGQQAPW